MAGDDVRSIDWRATARSADVMIRTWRPERDRHVLIVLDTGRTSAGRVGDIPRLDAAMAMRFVDGLLVAIERGTPLAEVLRAQAADVREAGKRRLLEAGGRKEIGMMIPVVFLVLPVTVLFALFPGLISIVSLAQ